MPQRIPARSARLAIASTAGALALVGASVPMSATAAQTCADISAQVDTELRDRFGAYGDTAGRWTRADSAYSVELPDGRVAWIYSDTFLGEVDETHGRPLDSMFIHNSINVDDDGADHDVHGRNARVARVARQGGPGADEGRDWYWFGDATVVGDELQVMLVEFVETGDTMWDFASGGNGVATFDAATLELRSVDPGPRRTASTGAPRSSRTPTTVTPTPTAWRTSALQSSRTSHALRAGDLADGEWEYLGDSGWSTDPAQDEADPRGRLERVQREPVPGPVYPRHRRHYITAQREGRDVPQQEPRRPVHR